MASPERWLFSPRTDVAVFGGTALLASLLVFLAPRFGVVGETPPWAWLIFVVGVDVSHVWSTIYRVYLDPAEVRRRPVLYAVAPIVAYTVSVAAHQRSPEFFWRLLAYVAVFHFVRQQVGWMVLYARRARHAEWEVKLDRAVMYAATVGPVLWWHANLPRPFSWFKPGDFIAGLPHQLGTAALVVHFAIIAAWLGVALVRRFRGVPLHTGKLLLLGATVTTWFGGIVIAKDDFAFTVMNVLQHGVPYLALLYFYAKGRQAEGGYGAWGVLLRVGVPGFMGLLLFIAYVEEFAWDRLVWHEHAMFFGARGPELSALALSLVVPLLSLPQTTHYVLDGYVWRTSDDQALGRRLGWARATR